MINVTAVNSYADWRLRYLSDHYQALYDRAHNIRLRDCCSCSCGATISIRSSFDYENNNQFIDHGRACTGCLRVYDYHEFKGDYKDASRRGLCADCRRHGVPEVVNAGALAPAGGAYNPCVGKTTDPRHDPALGRVKRSKPRRSVGPAIRFRILARDGHVCTYCGRRPPEVELEVDHIVPVAEGGPSNDYNLVTACRDCNRGKGASVAV